MFNDYLKKVEESIAKVKADSTQKLKRKVLFNSGIDFHGTNLSPEDRSEMHPDECLRQGVQEFKRKSHKIVIQEMNIDQKILDQQRELLLKQQQQREEAEKQQQQR